MRIAASLCALAALAGPAWAEDTPPIPRERSKNVGPEVGKKEFELGMALYQAGRYTEARALFEEAYLYSDHRPTTIRALAQCERMLEHDERAVELFREYLATGPSDGAQIQQTIATLEARIRAKGPKSEPLLAPPPSATPKAPPRARPTPAAPATPRPEPSPTPTFEPSPEPAPPPPPAVTEGAALTAEAPSGPSHLPQIATTAGGSAALAVGVVLFAIGQSAKANVEDAAPGSAFADVAADADRAPALMTAGTVLGSVGLAALGAGIVWWVSSE